MLRSAVRGSCAAIGVFMVIVAVELPQIPNEWAWRTIGLYLALSNMLPGIVEGIRETMRCDD
ncbi:MAG: hypothetical protein IIX61_05925 [Loktanella sp.]|nr:hypothetical protein [Loktanella sp.]